jgi:hypothetical protein
MADNLLQQVAPPALPGYPNGYDRLAFEQFSNVLRLYFNRLNTNVNNLTGDTGGRYLQFPYAAVQRTTDKTLVANTATQITFNVNDFLNGCSNDGTDGIRVTYSGIYNYQFSVQFANTSTSIHEAWIWLRVNGVDVPGTGSRFSVPNKHGGVDGYLIAAANFYVEMQAGDTVEMWSAVDNVAVYMEAYAAQTSPFAMPSIPSVVATLTFVSAT